MLEVQFWETKTHLPEQHATLPEDPPLTALRLITSFKPFT